MELAVIKCREVSEVAFFLQVDKLLKGYALDALVTLLLESEELESVLSVLSLIDSV